LAMQRPALMAEEHDGTATVTHSRQVIAMSRHVISTATAHIEVALRSIDHTRNLLQSVWLKRELRRRRDREQL
jgi:hypothetical protein